MAEIVGAAVDNRIFTQDGIQLALSDLNARPFSRAAHQVAEDLKALNLADPKSGQLLLSNFSRYGFAVLEPGQGTAAVVARAFECLKEFLHHAPLEDKLAFRQGGNPGMDVKYNPPKLRGSERSPFEEIIAQRDFVLSNEFAERWPRSATKLREAAMHLMRNFEEVAQQILNTIEELYHAPEGLFSEIAFNSDLSTLRMIHCMPEREVFARPEAYGQTDKAYQLHNSNEPLRRCINIHTDWGPLTILPVATSGGLEYWYQDTEHSEGAGSGWVDLAAQKGQLLAMLGNVSDIFSRGTLRSVPHRVRVTEDQERFSFAYFVEIKSHVDLDRITSSLVVPNISNESRSFYEREARQKIVGVLTAKKYLDFMIHR